MSKQKQPTFDEMQATKKAMEDFVERHALSSPDEAEEVFYVQTIHDDGKWRGVMSSRTPKFSTV